MSLPDLFQPRFEYPQGDQDSRISYEDRFAVIRTAKSGQSIDQEAQEIPSNSYVVIQEKSVENFGFQNNLVAKFFSV